MTTPSTSEQPTPRRTINIREGALAQLPYSDGVLVGKTLYLSGRVGVDPATDTLPADIEQEIKFLLDHFKSVLAKASMTMDDLVSVTVYCPDVALFQQFNDIYKTYFTRGLPARAFVGSGPLLFGAHFQMQAIAIK